MSTINLNPILGEDPNKLYRSNLLKARFVKIASTINLISIIILSIYLFSFIGISPKIITLFHLAQGIFPPILGISFMLLQNYSKKTYKISNFYKKISSKLNILKNQNENEIKNYLNKIKCSNINNIKKILPALAHYKVWKKTIEHFLNEIKKIQTTLNKKENSQYKMQKIIHEIYEKKILTAKLKLVQTYHIINNPADKKMLNAFGKIIINSFAKRMALILQENDYYFVFHDNIQKQRQRKGLCFTDLDNMEIEDISKLIYGN